MIDGGGHMLPARGKNWAFKPWPKPLPARPLTPRDGCNETK